MGLLRLLIEIYIWILIISALLSWFPTTSSQGGLATTKQVLTRLTEPVLRPLRQIIPRPNIGGVGVDFSVLVAVIVLQIIASSI
ncbi:MAG: YggT family protein [Acidobacteria bacterium]|nr:YggT family protein [Acidobacteriota bacterium]